MGEKELKKENILTVQTEKPSYKKITLIILLVLAVIIISLGISAYLYFKTPEKTLGIGANIEEALLSEDGEIAYIKLAGESDKNITKIKFIFTDAKGNEYDYETSEGASEISVPFKRSFWQWLLRKPKYEGVYDYEINANEINLENFSDIEEVSVLFEHKTETGDINETGIITSANITKIPTCNDKIKNGDETGIDCGGSCKACSQGGGEGGGGGGETTPPCTPNKDCSYYYNLGQCGSGLSDGCSAILDCLTCPGGKVCADGRCVEIINCTSNENCSYLNDVCAIWVCNATGSCELSYNVSTDVCREAVGECDEEENCTGSSSSCSVDVFKINGIACSLGVCDGNGNCIVDVCAGISSCDDYTDDTNCTADVCGVGVCEWNITTNICEKSPVLKTNKISQFNITWYFDKEYEYGQFANGDYWVVGPVTVIGIDPVSTENATTGRVMHGSMLDPTYITGSYQGLDSAIGGWVSSYNVARPDGNDLSAGNPLVIEPSHSLVSVKSTDIVTRYQLQDAAILTILGSTPEPNSFRPPYSGTDKTIRYNVNDIDYSGLSTLTPVASAPSLATAEGWFERPWLSFYSYIDGVHPVNNMPGRQDLFAERIGEGALFLNLNYTNAQKKTLMIRFVQVGIDLYGILTNGDGRVIWDGNGAQSQGRKMPILFAGTVLNDPNMKAIGDKSGDYMYSNGYGPGNTPPDYVHFAEDDQIFYVDANDVFTPPYTLRPAYTNPGKGTTYGNVKVVHDSNVVVGIGTSWLGLTYYSTVEQPGTDPSHYFYFGVEKDNKAYETGFIQYSVGYVIESIDSNTQITLTAPYQGDTNETGNAKYATSGQIFYGHGLPGVGLTQGFDYSEYLSANIGLPEWGINHNSARYKDGLDWCANYRQNMGRGGLGSHQLAALIMGFKTLWNHDAYFDYADRYMVIEIGGSARSLSDFSEDMWDTYRTNYGCVWTRNNQSNLYSLGHYNCSDCSYNCLTSPYCGDGECNGNETVKSCEWDCAEAPFIKVDYYVDANLQDDCNRTYSIVNRNCSGSNGTAFNTIQEAANVVKAGETIVVREGIYKGAVYLTKSGNPNEIIIFNTNGNVVLNGSLDINTNYIHIKGFEIVGGGIFVKGNFSQILDNYVHDRTGSVGIGAYGNYGIVRNNTIVRAVGCGIKVDGKNNLIEENDISHTLIKPPDGSYTTDADGIRFFGSGHIFRRNYIHHIMHSENNFPQEDPHIDGFQTWGPASDITFEQNLYESIDTFGSNQIVMVSDLDGDVKNLTFRNNIFVMNDPGYSPMSFYSNQTWMGKTNILRDITIVHNTFVHKNDVATGAIWMRGIKNVTIKNNIFYDYCSESVKSYVSFYADYPSENIIIGNNNVYNSNNLYPANGNYSNDLWEIDPEFVNFENMDFHLQATSPCIDRGETLLGVTQDYDGNSRPQGTGYDIGAYEYNGTIGQSASLSPLARIWNFFKSLLTAKTGNAITGNVVSENGSKINNESNFIIKIINLIKNIFK